MSEHYNTGSGWPQTRAEVDAASDDVLRDFMGMCDVEPADFDGCLACYAYEVVGDRETASRASQVGKLEEQKSAIFALVDTMLEHEKTTEDITGWRAIAKVLIRLYNGWELVDDNGTWRWYSTAGLRYSDELPTETEMGVLNAALKMR